MGDAVGVMKYCNAGEGIIALGQCSKFTNQRAAQLLLVKLRSHAYWWEIGISGDDLNLVKVYQHLLFRL